MRPGLIVVLGIGLIALATAARSGHASSPGQIAFSVENHTTDTAAYRATLGGSERKISLQAAELRVSPRGSRIAFTVFPARGLCVVGHEGRRLRSEKANGGSAQ
jgi:hypothetical protein